VAKGGQNAKSDIVFKKAVMAHHLKIQVKGGQGACCLRWSALVGMVVLPTKAPTAVPKVNCKNVCADQVRIGCLGSGNLWVG
jgi:hypothetical protein